MTNPGKANELVLILGATGKTGRRVVDRLTARGIPVRAASRSSQTRFDWDDSSTWAPALRDVTAVYLAYAPDLAVPGATEAVTGFARLAVEHGVTRLVLLSGRGEEEAERAEQAVQRVAPHATVVRCSFFNQNFSEGDWLADVLGGTVAFPVDGALEPFLDADDIADVAVAALTESGHAGELYELTGPRSLDFPSAVGEIAAASSRDVRFASVPIDDYVSALHAHGVPPAVVELLTYLFTHVLDGRNASVTDGVRRALGREPRDFRDYARATAATGVWGAPDGTHADAAVLAGGSTVGSSGPL